MKNNQNDDFLKLLQKVANSIPEKYTALPEVFTFYSSSKNIENLKKDFNEAITKNHQKK